MKSKLNKTRVFSSLLVATALGAACFTVPSAVKAAPDGAAFLSGKSNDREVIKTVVRNVLNFRSEMPMSDDQKDKLKTIFESHKDDIRAQREKTTSARSALHAAAKVDPESKATLEAADEIAAAARSRALLTAKIRSEVRPVLTGDQLQYAENAIEEIRSAVDKATERFE